MITWDLSTAVAVAGLLAILSFFLVFLVFKKKD